jgi:hypothetical protein
MPQLVDVSSVVAIYGPICPKSGDVVADLAASDDVEKSAIEDSAASTPFSLAGHGSRGFSFAAGHARDALVQPRLGRDAERSVHVDPAPLLEASAIRVSDIPAKRVFLGSARDRRLVKKPVDAAFDPARCRWR